MNMLNPRDEAEYARRAAADMLPKSESEYVIEWAGHAEGEYSVIRHSLGLAIFRDEADARETMETEMRKEPRGWYRLVRVTRETLAHVDAEIPCDGGCVDGYAHRIGCPAAF